MLKERGSVVLFIIVFMAVIGFIALVWAGIDHEREKVKAFMADCLADGRKQYECTAMWRAGESSTVVVPVPVGR